MFYIYPEKKEISMFYIVPSGRSVDHFIATTESFEAARFHVNFMKKARDEECDIIEMRRYPFDQIHEVVILNGEVQF